MEQTKQGQRAGSTLAGTRQEAELPAKPCGVQDQVGEQQGLLLG